MFLVGILLLLCSAWWPLQIGYVSGIAMAWCLIFYPRSWVEGWLGATMLWVGYLWWIPWFIHEHLRSSLSGAWALSLLLLLYVSGASWVVWRASWWIANNAVVRPWVRSTFAGGIFLWWATCASLPFISCMSGYLFMNPLLPALVWSRDLFSTSVPQKTWVSCLLGAQEIQLYYLPPLPDESRGALTQKIYVALNSISMPGSQGDGYVVSPESMFPYRLQPEEGPECALWRSVVPERVTWVFGGVQTRSQSDLQTLFFLNKSLIIDRYEKQHLVDFFELPAQGWLQKVIGAFFSLENNTFTCGDCPNRGGGGAFQPALCSDLFTLERDDSKDGVLVAANEHWLPNWVALLWQGYGIYWTLSAQKAVVWVGWHECRLLNKKRGHVAQLERHAL
ncbi:MAG: hypothetical protein QG604_93 [Candidatus Dependentiae bacterium]|nr:hypothetical protein [Candidatus Dependentiae bacterium]